MRPLLIGPDDVEKINSIVEYAGKNIFSINSIQQIIAGQIPCACDFSEHTIILKFGYRCVFSFEETEHGLCRYLSVSVAKKGSYPNTIAFSEIMRLFGFESNFQTIIDDNKIGVFWIDDKYETVNIMEKIKGNFHG